MRLVLASFCLVFAACGSSSTGMDMTSVVAMDMSVPNIDAGPPECDIIDNTGCAAGEKCTIGSDNGAPRNICFALASPAVAEGGDCMSVTMGKRVGDNCAAGLSCILYPGDGSKCRKPCYLRQQCAGGSGCVVATTSHDVASFDGSLERLRACHVDEGCDPVAQSVCTGGKGCYLSASDNIGRLGVCLMTQTPGMDGAECTHINDCAPGFRCDSFGFCRRYCYFRTATGGIPTTGQCPPAEGSCQLFSFAGDRYGVCGAL